ncbi:V-type ATP synthase subunit I [bacterium]|nr:V-type ATP synthase subunit I [bacterium]
MAILPMLRLFLVGHKDDEEDVLSLLQDLGVLEIEKVNLDNDFSLEWLPSKISDISRELNRIRSNILFLKDFVEVKSSVIDLFVPQKLPLSNKEREDLIKNFNNNGGYGTVESWQSSLEEIKSSINTLSQDKEILTPFENLNFSIRSIRELKYVDVFLGQIRKGDLEKFTEEIKGYLADISVVRETSQYVFFIVVAHKDVVGEVRGVFSKYNVTIFNLEKFSGTPKEELASIERRIDILVKRREEILEEIKKKGNELLNALYVQYDNYQNDLIRYEHLGRIIHTKNMFFITGWIREKDAKEIKEMLEKRFKDLYVETSKPEPEDEPPVALENNSFTSPFEVVTGIYGYPNSKEFDPTPLLAPFFAVFFALCLTDAFYGIILSILSLYLYRNLVIERHRKKLLQLLFICGLFTIGAGAITGGWFGNVSEAFKFLSFFEPIRRKLILFDPLKDPIIFLGLSLALGFIQIIFGLFIKMLLNLKRRQYKEAIFDQLFWILFLLSIVFTGGTFTVEGLKFMSKIATYFTLIMAIALVATQGRHQRSIFLKITSGLGSLYSVISYLSDVLSYSRLLALGLATGVIATVVNELVKTFSGIPILGTIIGVVIFIGGHLFNMIINTFGAFVHTSRLQFVEFFGKFFEGGGREFNPLRKIRTYTIEKEVME